MVAGAIQCLDEAIAGLPLPSDGLSGVGFRCFCRRRWGGGVFRCDWNLCSTFRGSLLKAACRRCLLRAFKRGGAEFPPPANSGRRRRQNNDQRDAPGSETRGQRNFSGCRHDKKTREYPSGGLSLYLPHRGVTIHRWMRRWRIFFQDQRVKRMPQLVGMNERLELSKPGCFRPGRRE